jgi:hypothetical protein
MKENFSLWTNEDGGWKGRLQLFINMLEGVLETVSSVLSNLLSSSQHGVELWKTNLR